MDVVPERWNLWLCPECRWLGWSEDGHCRQFDEHEGERVALEPVTVVLDPPRGAVSAEHWIVVEHGDVQRASHNVPALRDGRYVHEAEAVEAEPPPTQGVVSADPAEVERARDYWNALAKSWGAEKDRLAARVEQLEAENADLRASLKMAEQDLRDA